jgi:hypothetical protein
MLVNNVEKITQCVTMTTFLFTIYLFCRITVLCQIYPAGPYRSKMDVGALPYYGTVKKAAVIFRPVVKVPQNTTLGVGGGI